MSRAAAAAARRHDHTRARPFTQSRPGASGRAGGHRRPRARRHGQVSGERRRVQGRLRLDEPASVLLGRGRPLRGDGRCEAEVRLRVPRQLVPVGHHAPDGQVLPHPHGRPADDPRRRARGARRHGQDGDDERSGKGRGHAVRRLQLLRRPRLPSYGQVFQRIGFLRRLGMLRRIQPHQHRGPFGHRPADRVDPVGHQRPRGFHALRGVVHPDQARLRRLYYHEPGLRRPQRAPGFPVRALPARRHDGPRLRPHRRDHVLRLWVRGRQGARLEDGHDVQALLGAVLVAAALRLRHARGQDGHHGGGQLEAGRTDGGRVHLAPPGAARRERAQILGRRLAPLPGHHLRFVPRSFEAGARLRGAVCGSEAGDAKGKLAAARVVCFQDHSALRDDRRPPRPHARRADGRRQVGEHAHPRGDARGAVRQGPGRLCLPKSAHLPAQPKVHHHGPDVRRVRPQHARVAGRHHVDHVQASRGLDDSGPEMDPVRRSGGRHLDREHEHRPGRQQEAVSGLG
mmetsp:Transcript_23333/g.80910  ORF Transcript_23333/g.80910 Transcript_23333/m.80910 type:complete len:513 (-) Transcript_23333:1104-2642(-)